MKTKFLTALATMALGCVFSQSIEAQLRTNGGVQYLLSQSKDMSQDFSDLSNHYFFADSLVSLDPATGTATVKWVRRQLMPRQAFNANTYLHQPLTALDFPNTAYDNDPELRMSIDPVNDRTLRIRMYTSPVIPKELEDDPMLVGTPAVDRNAWKVSETKDAVIYTSANGSLEIKRHPWRLVLKDANGKVMTQSRVWSDNDSTQVKVAPFSFIKRGSDNSRSINPVFSLLR